MDTRNSSGLEIRFRTWSELVTSLEECQDSLPDSNTSFMTEKVMEGLIEKLSSPSASTTFVSSSEKYSQTPWWFKDLVFLNTDFVEKLVRTMVSHKLDHGVISKFLFHYRKFKLSGAKPDQKCAISEAVISLLGLLDAQAISFKGLFEVYQADSTAKVNKKHQNMLERLIGSQLDQATLDYLLVPSPKGKRYIYDVNMVLKLVKSFVRTMDQCNLPASRLNKVGRLIDSYLAEISLDLHMKHSKFSALVMTLPDCARESHDALYLAIDMYFEVHRELCEEAKISLCCALNYEKLSTEALGHLAKNPKFPSKISVKGFMSQSSKLTRLIREIYHFKSFRDSSWLRDTFEELSSAHGDDKRLSENLQELMHWNEVELKKDRQRIRKQSEMACIKRSRMSASGKSRYLPKLCGC